MKFFFILLLTSSMAHARALEKVHASYCDSGALHHNQGFSYRVAQNENDNRVKADLTLSHDHGDTVYYTSVITPVIPTLEKVEDQIIHTSSGTVCAVFKKRGLFGSKSWVPTADCSYTLVDKTVEVMDEDDFEMKTVCSRKYFLNVRI